MKAYLTVLVASCFGLSACSPKPTAVQQEVINNAPPLPVTKIDSSSAWDEAIERCYQGVTYVVFPNGNGSVGGAAKFDVNSKVVPCGNK